MTDFSKYINLKYVHKGRSFSGVDCYGLVYLVLKNEKQIELSEYEYSRNWFLEGKNYIIEIKKDLINWLDVAIERINPFDVILFYATPRKFIVNHMGLCIGEEKFIHISEGYNSRVDRLNNLWLNKVYAAVRYSKGVQ